MCKFAHIVEKQIFTKMKKVEELKKFLEVEELSKLEQGAVQGGAAEGKQKIKQKNEDDGTITQTNN